MDDPKHRSYNSTDVFIQISQEVPEDCSKFLENLSYPNNGFNNKLYLKLLHNFFDP